MVMIDSCGTVHSSGSFVLNKSTIPGKGLKALNTPLAYIRSFVRY